MRIVHLSLNAFQHASRALRAISATKAVVPSAQILVLAFFDRNLPETEVLTDDVVVKRLRIKSRSLPKALLAQLVKYLEWGFRASKNALAFRPDIVQCHSLPALPIGVIIKTLSGARILYDAHELETERNGITGIRQRLSRLVEYALMRFVDETIVVSPGIARWYEARYPRMRFSIVRNAPAIGHIADSPFALRREIGASESDVVILYLGGLLPGRGIPIILDAFRDLPPKYKMVFVGHGVSESTISDVAAKSPNIRLFKAVRPNEVVSTARAADIGISLLDSKSLSYRYALPNKLFEYTLAGIPSIVNDDFPDMAEFVANEGAGWTVSLKADALADLIRSIDQSDVGEKKRRLSERGCTPCWEQEAPKLMDVYYRLLAGRLAI